MDTLPHRCHASNAPRREAIPLGSADAGGTFWAADVEPPSRGVSLAAELGSGTCFDFQSRTRMKLALFADIHSNLEAITACIAHAQALGADRYAFLGDLV